MARVKRAVHAKKKHKAILEKAKALGLTPRARFHSFALAGVDPPRRTDEVAADPRGGKDGLRRLFHHRGGNA